jgi:hypothetical protein
MLFLFNHTLDTLTDLPFGADKWIIGNYMRLFAQFRINYDLQNWILLTEQLIKNANVSKSAFCLMLSNLQFYAFNYGTSKELGLSDRNQLIDDSFYLSNNGKLSVRVALNILEYLPNENSYLPWKLAIDHIKVLLSYIEDDSSVYGNFRVQKCFISKYLKKKAFQNTVTF